MTFVSRIKRITTVAIDSGGGGGGKTGKMHNKKNIWWRDYRKRINRPRARNMSLEIVMRAVFKKTLRAYLHNCSFAGVSKIFDQNVGFRQRYKIYILWFLLLRTLFQ